MKSERCSSQWLHRLDAFLGRHRFAGLLVISLLNGPRCLLGCHGPAARAFFAGAASRAPLGALTVHPSCCDSTCVHGSPGHGPCVAGGPAQRNPSGLGLRSSEPAPLRSSHQTKQCSAWLASGLVMAPAFKLLAVFIQAIFRSLIGPANGLQAVACQGEKPASG